MSPAIKLYVGITDLDWFTFLAQCRDVEEVNFWQPGGRTQFRALRPGELFLFKLHSPNNVIVGGGLFGHASIVPISLAWEAFGPMNGAASLDEMRQRIAHYRHEPVDPRADHAIGCRILEQPFFWPRELACPIHAAGASLARRSQRRAGDAKAPRASQEPRVSRLCKVLSMD